MRTLVGEVPDPGGSYLIEIEGCDGCFASVVWQLQGSEAGFLALLSHALQDAAVGEPGGPKPRLNLKHIKETVAA